MKQRLGANVIAPVYQLQETRRGWLYATSVKEMRYVGADLSSDLR